MTTEVRMRIERLIATASLLAVAMMAPGQTQLAIKGTATYRERMALPPDAVFEASLEDVSLTDAKARVIASMRNEQPGNPPFHFKISYDPTKIVSTHSYAVRARVTEGSKLLFTTDQRYLVLTNGHGSEIAMMMLKHVSSNTAMSGSAAAAGAQIAQAADEPLRDTYWKLIELEGKPVAAAEQQREAHLVFHAKDSRITGSGGCNRLMGRYMVDGSSIHFKGVASTMMACLHGMDTEQAFVGVLNRVVSWKISGKQLELLGSGDALLGKFEATALK
jgi:putative lipoprotein